MRAAKILLEKGELSPDLTTKKALRELGGALVAVTLGRLYSEPDMLAPLRSFVRAVARLIDRDKSIATSVLTKVCFLGPAETADTIRRLVHEERVEGSASILALDTSKVALDAAAKVDL